jgi:RimJ/RimL family protein N-acetyltransferase
MEKIMIFIKHNLSFLWILVEWCNGTLFYLLYPSGIERVLHLVFKEAANPLFSYKRLTQFDVGAVQDIINSQLPSDLEYFKPHSFDQSSIRKQFRNPSFLPMGFFDGEKLIGYFFLRFFVNKKCFVGRLIDKDYRGKGIGLIMNTIMYEIAWRMGFRCLSTISRKNTSVMKAHSKNKNMIVLKELQNDYLLVEFIRGASEK